MLSLSSLLFSITRALGAHRDSLRWAMGLTFSLFACAASAQGTGGLAKAQTTMQMILDNLNIILPIAAVIIGVIIWVLYSAEIMRKDDAVRWVIGVIGAASAGEIVVLLWK